MTSSFCKLRKTPNSINIRCHLLVQEILILLGANDTPQCDLILFNLQTQTFYDVIYYVNNITEFTFVKYFGVV